MKKKPNVSLRVNPDVDPRTHRHITTGKKESKFGIDLKRAYELFLDKNRFPVKAGDVICIEDGEFHKVHNTGHLGLYFVCVFDGGRNH